MMLRGRYRGERLGLTFLGLDDERERERERDMTILLPPSTCGVRRGLIAMKKMRNGCDG